MQRTIITLLLLWLSSLSKAQGVDFRPLNVATGLRNNQVWFMRPLCNKTILIGYPDAFSIFDGTFSHDLDFNPQQHISLDGFATTSYEDRKHRVWIKQYKRMFVLDETTGTFIASPSELLSASGIASSDVCDLFFDSDTTAYIYKKGGAVYSYDFKGKAKKIYQLSRRQLAAKIVPTGIETINGQRLLFFSDGELRCMLASGDRTLIAGGKENKPFATVCTLPLDKQNLLMAGASMGLTVYNSTTHTLATVDASPQTYVRLLRDDMGNIISVGQTEIKVYDRFLHLQNTTQQPQRGKSFQDRIISDGAIDWQGGMWISTFLNGIYYYNIHGDEQHVWELPDKGQEVRSCAALPNGNMAYCTANAVYIFNTQTHQYHLLTQKQGWTFYQVSCDSQGALYATSSYGVARFGADGSMTMLSANKGMFAVPSAGRLYTNKGSKGFGYIDLATKQWRAMPIPQSIQHQPTDYWACAIDRYRKRIYLQTSEHLLCFDMSKQRWSVLSDIEPAAAGIKTRAEQILCLGKGGTLFAALDGLHMLTSDHRLLTVAKGKGLNNNTVRAVCKSSMQDSYWVATANGLVGVSIGKDGKTTVRRFAVRGLDDGSEIVPRGLFALPSGVWLATSNSIVRFCPKNLTARQIYAYRPVLTNITVMGREASRTLANGERLSLSYDENFFSLTFSACNYMRPEQTVYRYRLEDVDYDWREVSPKDGALEVSYTNVSPGCKTFEVQVQDENGEWGEATVLTIDIAPPFWRTWWAYTIYGLLFMGVIVGGYKVYNARRTLLARLKEKRNKMLIQADKVKPEDIEIKSQDELFIKKAVALVEEHLSDSDYNASALSSDMALNRSHFYRKIHALTDQSPTEFIRTIRLRRGEAMLRVSGLSVSEVAYACGFSSAVFFRKYFKELYGVTPSDYKAGKRRGDISG